jgi:putative hydrolase of the HAD superfamily
MPVTTLLIDLDGTLYPHANGLWEAIGTKMDAYMVNSLNMPADQVPQIREEYFLKYGTTLRGLITHHGVDPVKYLAFVHDVPLENYLAKDERLKTILESLSQPKWILTNSDKAHSQRVLRILEVEDQFEGIIDVTAVNYLNKPDPIVFQIALEIAGGMEPEQCVFIDDIPHNLVPAKSLGMHTILVGAKDPVDHVDIHIPDIYSLPDAISLLKEKGMD